MARVTLALLLVTPALSGCLPGDGFDEDATYVALGDSFTSAPGVPVTEQLTGCARSDHNYPTLLAGKLRIDVTDSSCGAASTEHLTERQLTTRGYVAPQLDALSKGTDLVTLGIGANNSAAFATIFGSCVLLTAKDPEGSPCRDALATGTGDRLTDSLSATEDDLVAALEEIERRSPDARVVLVGYPQLLPRTGTCAALPLARGDYELARELWSGLGAVMERAASTAGVDYLDLTEASSGRDVCAGARAWLNGSRDDPARAAPYHPFPEEQEAVADLLVDLLD